MMPVIISRFTINGILGTDYAASIRQPIINERTVLTAVGLGI